MDVLGADEVKPIVIAVHAIVDTYTVQLDVVALDDADGMIGAGSEKNIADRKVVAAMEQQMIRTMVTTNPGGRQNVAAGTMKLYALAVNRSRPFNDDILGVDSKDQPDIAITQR